MPRAVSEGHPPYENRVGWDALRVSKTLKSRGMSAHHGGPAALSGSCAGLSWEAFRPVGQSLASKIIREFL